MTDAPDTLAQILADADEEVARLARYGHPEAADVLAGLVTRWKALHEFTVWHDEPGAMVLSGRSAAWFRARYAGWERRLLARSTRRGHREYLECVIPKAQRVDELLTDAEDTARRDAA